MNRGGTWIVASESAALLNGNLTFNDAFSIQTNNGEANELLCRINEFGDYVIITNNGVFRNGDRGHTNAKRALNHSSFTPTTFKPVLQLATNGAVAPLSEHGSTTDRNGVYWCMNVVTPAPPKPTGATLSGTFLDWTDGGGSTVGYLISAGTNPQSACASAGSPKWYELWVTGRTCPRGPREDSA